MSPTYTLYHGTFIQLPRHVTSNTKPSLEINTGVLWVSNSDGRIQGFDWSVDIDSDSEDEGEKGLNAFLQDKGWTVWREGVEEQGAETVKIVQGGRKGRNGFFFPGFIGMFLVVWIERRDQAKSDDSRYTYSCVSISERRHIWLIYITRLAKKIYLPHGEIL